MRKVKVATAIIVAVVLIAAGTAVVQGSASYSLSWLAGLAGTGSSSSANYGLRGAAGQSVTGSTSSSQYGIKPGTGTFAPSTHYVYLPAIVKGY
ncbi:MAG: hypothetical protein HYY30_10875 [Chloroflexi bacterium]|nr:hypothetical protein [Chloroflexota bacterium]